MLTALVAAVAMIASDIFGTILIQALAANRGWLAGAMDCIGWYVSIATTAISVTPLQGHNLATKLWVLGLVGVANVVGTKAGQLVGHFLLARRARAKALRLATDPSATLPTNEERITYVEQLLGVTHGVVR